MYLSSKFLLLFFECFLDFEGLASLLKQTCRRRYMAR